MLSELKIFTGNANPVLAREICADLGLPLSVAAVKTFSDGEIMVEIGENVRGRDVFVVQSTCAPSNQNLMELLVMVDALKRASAARITAVIPYFGYARQDRKVAPRTPITSKLVADLITTAGVHRVLCVDLHAGQIQGFFNIPVDHLYAAPVVLDDIRSRFTSRLVVVSPDAGGTERARAFAKRLDAGLAIIDKRRSGPNVSEVMHIIGEVAGRDLRHRRRHDRYRRHPLPGGDGAQGPRRRRHLRHGHPCGALRAGPGADQPELPQGSAGDQYHPGRGQALRLSAAAPAVGGQPAGGGDSSHSR